MTQNFATGGGPATPNAVSIAKYRRHAAGYDASAERTQGLRRRTIALLGLQPGDVVLDVGAGTGLSYALLREAVNADGHLPQAARGRVLAVEQSPDMFALAQARVAQEGWADVWQVCSAAEAVRLPEPPSALLFHFTHDILRSPQAVGNLVAQARPGARVAVAGMKFFPWWLAPLNLLAWLKNRPYNARAADLWAPWDILEPYCQSPQGLQRRSVLGGMAYVAHGRLR